MLLIADAGSSGTQWALLDGDKTISRFDSNAINPVTQSVDAIASTFALVCFGLEQYDAKVKRVFFYGAGCRGDYSSKVLDAIARMFPLAAISVQSDIYGACYALCGSKAGIVAILGTGSNSCSFDGRKVVESVPSLGYILGDEGSGGYLGRRLLSDIYKGLMPKCVIEKFQSEYALTIDAVIDRVYRCPDPNKFLASFTPFIRHNIDVPEMRQLVLNSFSDFIERNLASYPDAHVTPIGFVGSVAYYFSDLLRDALELHGMQAGNIIRSPLDGLIGYHQKNSRTNG